MVFISPPATGSECDSLFCGPRSQGARPDEAGRALPDGPLSPAVAAARQVRPIGPEDQEGGVALGGDLQQRIDRMGAAHPQPLDLYGQRAGELRGLAQRFLELLPLDVAV